MCDTFVALGNATSDGTVLFAKNSDREPNEAHEIVVIPAARHLPGESVKCTYIEIPQVDETYRVLLAKPFWIWGAEMGANEKGVVIGNEAVFTRVPYQKEPGLIGMDFLRLALERAGSADEGLSVITSLLEKYGQGGNCGFTHPFYYHNSYLIADRHSAWVLETAGKEWAAEKVVDVRAISNLLTIQNKWDLASKNMVDFALKKGWSKQREGFNFREAYTEPVYTFFGDGDDRQCFVQRQLEESKGKIDTAFMMQLLRTHQHARDNDWSPDKALLGADVCMHASWGPARGSQSVGSLVSHMSEKGDTHWVTGTSAPCVSIFKPVWIENEFTFGGEAPSGEYNQASLYWQHESLHREILKNYAISAPKYTLMREPLEASFLKGEEECRDRSAVEKFDFSAQCFQQAANMEKQAADQLFSARIQKKNRIYYQNFWNKINRSAKMN